MFVVSQAYGSRKADYTLWCL